jgi:hypothetical protein
MYNFSCTGSINFLLCKHFMFPILYWKMLGWKYNIWLIKFQKLLLYLHTHHFIGQISDQAILTQFSHVSLNYNYTLLKLYQNFLPSFNSEATIVKHFYQEIKYDDYICWQTFSIWVKSCSMPVHAHLNLKIAFSECIYKLYLFGWRHFCRDKSEFIGKIRTKL